MKKADVLFLLVGTNPMPNIISTLYRVKDKGELYCLHTEGDIGEGTEEIAEKLKEVISRIKCDLKINLIKIYNTDDNIDNTISDLTRNNLGQAEIIELNYTGGTKIMSSTAYMYFKKLSEKYIDKMINLTYLDNEKKQFIVETLYKGEKVVRIKSLDEVIEKQEISIKEIAKIHCVDIEYDKPKVINKSACIKVFNKILDVSTRENTIKLLESYYKKVKNINKINKLIKLKEKEDPFLEIYELLEVEKNFEALGFEDGFDELKAVEYFKGFWLEDYILNLLFENKENWGISEIAHSVENEKSYKDKDFEVDIVILKNHITYFLSVSTIDYYEGVLNKLYEVNYRANQLSGDSGKIGIVNLYKDSKEIENNYTRFWENSERKNYMIVQFDKLQFLEEEIKSWIS